MDELTELEKLFDNFRISGQDGITIHGSLRTGYAIQTQPIGGAEAPGFPGAVIPIGACCVDGDCSVGSQAGCDVLGGDYQGDGTMCDPNPCLQGACCFNDGSCLVEPQADCDEQGGTYYGDGTNCDPSPCPQPAGCPCAGDTHCCGLGFGFDAFDGSGRKFLNKKTTYHLAYSNSGDSNCGLGVTTDSDWVVIRTYGCSPCGVDEQSCDPKCCVPNASSTWTCIHGFGTDTCDSHITSTCENPDLDGCFVWSGNIHHSDGTTTPIGSPCNQTLGYGLCTPFPIIDSAILQHYTCTNGATLTDELSVECL